MLPQYEEWKKINSFEDQPSKTYRLDLERNLVNGHCDGLEAVKQAIFAILNTERYDYPIYSWNYGAELSDLVGKPIGFAYTEAKDRMIDALMQDDRIIEVGKFSAVMERGELSITFQVQTKFGQLEIERAVKI